uniref:Uncharacterized protein n=1 Tax=Macaca fascicularis TaxID=9541 RepID=A0A7N9CIK1_MACFA
MAKRAPDMSQSGAPEGARHKPWWLSCGVKPAGTQRTRVEAWEPLPRFQRIYENVWMFRQKFAAGVEPLWTTSTRAVQRRNVGLEPPLTVPTGALPSGAVRRRQLFSRPQNGRPTDSLNCAPGKATRTQWQHLRVAMGAEYCRATGAGLPKALRAHPLHWCGLDIDMKSKEIILELKI